MEWRTVTNKRESKKSDNKSQNTYKPKFNNSKGNGRFNQSDNTNDEQSKFKNNKYESRFERSNKSEDKNSRVFSKNNKKKHYNKEPKEYYQSYQDVDKVLNSGKYIPAGKRSKLEEIRKKLKEEYDRNHPDISNEEMFPSLSKTSEIADQKPKTCWGQKLPDNIFDTTVQFSRHKVVPQNNKKVNSEISDDHEYDSFDDEDDYYNDFDDDYDDDDEYYNNGY